ncbi:MAG: hypothetical protein R3E84_03585 [Pseudomonadales bacterium]
MNILNFRRTTAVVAATLLLTATALPAQAGHRNHGWQGHGYHHSGYRAPYYGYRSSHHHHGDRGAYLVGGLLVGSLLAGAWYDNYYAPRVVSQPVYREVVYDTTPLVRSTRVIREEGRRLFRDRNGNCFERSLSANGDDLLVELDPAECAW